MRKLIAYILTVLYYFFFGLFLVIFHPIQWISLKFGGYNVHKKSVDYLNFFLVSCLYILGTKIKFNNKYQLPENKPLIIVSNHQSMNDIPPYIWFLRKYHPKFVSKKELGKGIPSISFNLKHGGSVLIDRKDSKQALNAIINFGKYIEKHNYSAVIFPEGTRSRTGEPKRFSENGLKMLVENAPSSYIVPITVNNSWKLLKYGGFPMEIGVNLTFDVHEPIKANSLPFDELFSKVETEIKSKVIVNS
ncbi:1-acyl-sn-glycerol-3-phosphate acyltransferase [Lutibacter sp. B1]|uniref:lysophospholipid acyltransferase family protein n=1 Tax=Lutibacter sp. B1 TaxID=2725996 RepID=UPI0014573375|nr:lysophospholipid acyltransferase family protein [Lutibacter sp. B1]NLP57179.1 1-acyl-sn-glycerol-3-phosphate acyltransferase [Lutibacter sp. B1]